MGPAGLIRGPVTIQSAGRLAPGASIGTLTISNSLTLSGITVIELNAATRTNDLVRGITTVTYGGTLILSNLAGSFSPSNAFKLFSASSYRGAFTALTPASPGEDLSWNTNTLVTDGTLRVVSTFPVTMSKALSGSRLTLSWPADHIGWRLQVQTNSVVGTNWFNIPNTRATNQMTLTLDPALNCVFYRLVYP